MAEEKDFSLISVSGDEEDDIVIQAGAVGENEAPENAADESAADEGGPSVEDVAAEPEPDAAEPEPEPEPESKKRIPHIEGVSDETAALLADADEEARAEFALHMKQKRAREAEALITTEKDLHEKTPHQSMRIWILVVMALIIVAFVIYWNVSMGA